LQAPGRPLALRVPDRPHQRAAGARRRGAGASREGRRDRDQRRRGRGGEGAAGERPVPEEALIPPPASVRRILIRANNWIGDVVMISPAVRALRERFTGAEIAILARPWVLDALAANPCFDRLIPYESP